MLEDIFGSVVNDKAAAAAVEQSEALFMQYRLKEADDLLARQLKETPEAPDVLDEAIKIKCIRFCYSEAARLARTWQGVTGKDYPMRAIIATAEEYQAKDAPAMADETFACLAEVARGTRITGASNGVFNGRFVNFLTITASDAQVKALNAAVADRLRERLGIEEPGIVVINDGESKTLDVYGKLRHLHEKGFDIETFMDTYRETLEENGVDPDDPEVMEVLNHFLGLMAERMAKGQGLDPEALGGLI